MIGIEESRPITHYMPYRAAHENRKRAQRESAHVFDGRIINVGDTERLVSAAMGAILGLLGLARRNLTGLVITSVGGALLYRGATGRCYAYEALGIDTADETAKQRARQGFRVVHSVLIGKSPEALYSYWRKLDNLPNIMTHLESVRVIDDRRSHWTAMAPAIAGGTVEWDAEIVTDIPNQRIEWRSLEGAEVKSRGSVEFRRMPVDRGTAVRVEMEYRPPAGRVGKWVAKIFGEAPDQQIREDLRTFKRLMEVGEAPSIEGQPHGSCMGLGMFRHS
jgi:uncharacterized membrane protein